MDGPLYTTVNGFAYQRMDWKPSKFLIPGVNYEPETSVEEAEKAQLEEMEESSKILRSRGHGKT